MPEGGRCRHRKGTSGAAKSGHRIATDFFNYLGSSPQVPTNRYLPKLLARTCRLKGCPLSERTDPFRELGRSTLPLNFRNPKIDILELDGDGQVRQIGVG